MDKIYGSAEIDYNEDETNAKFLEDESQNEEAELQPVNVDHNQMRMKYLSRLAKQQVWLSPMKQPKVSQNLVIFDWDDTIFPTSHLNPVDETVYDQLYERF